MINLIITILLLCYIIVKEYFSYKERKDLYDRLMAKNIYEYQELSQEKPKDESSSNFIKANIDKLKINNNGIS